MDKQVTPVDVDVAIDAFAQAPQAPGVRAQLRTAINAYARGRLGDLADVVHDAVAALASRRLTGTETLPAFVKMLREQGRTDVQLERMLADVFEGLVVHLHTRGDPETSIHTCRDKDIAPATSGEGVGR
jgi:hypothetical protein